ncbi:hypothetical protein RUM44_007523 [Polyplax serrata]|uniref:Zinc finger CHCC-type domain-containing protein n=1 Tax=Polyplax serrata TaxID=468196 RepID=A0ABR1B0Z7_POLSC
MAFEKLRFVFKKIGNPLPLYCNSSVKRNITSYINWEPKEKETHTGQKWDENDYRMVRFIDKPKQVNPNWAIKLISEIPPVAVKGRVTCCDGGSGPTGHPKDKPGNHSCLYCGLRFYKEANH